MATITEQEIQALLKWKCCRAPHALMMSDKQCKKRIKWARLAAQKHARPWAPACGLCLGCKGPVKRGKEEVPE